MPMIFLFSSCSGEHAVKKKVFDKIDYGMHKSQVKSLLGEPYEIKYIDSTETYYYRVRHKGRGTRNGQVQFDKNDYVSDFHAGLGS